MSAHHLHGHLTAFKGRLKRHWGRLTNDRLRQLDGAWDQLNGLLQREYDMSKHEIDAQLGALRRKYERGWPYADAPRPPHAAAHVAQVGAVCRSAFGDRART